MLDYHQTSPETEARSDFLIPDRVVCDQFQIVPRTLARWEKSATLKFPGAVRINGRKYRSHHQLEQFKARILAAAIPVAA